MTKPPATPTITFTSAPATVNAGDSSVLTWNVTDASSVSIDQGIGKVALSGSTQVKPNATTTYTLTAIGVDGPVTATATVTVNGSGGGGTPAAPTIQLTADHTSITAGQSATLSWTSTNATAITIDNGVGSVAAPSGTHTVTPTATTTYTATATGAGGTATATLTITVTAAPPTAPTIQLTADHTSITSGQTATLSWTSTNATSITIDNGIGSVAAPSGTHPVSPTTTTTYTATATGAGGTATATVTITVTAAPAAPTIQLTADHTSITAGQPVTLSWSSSNATSISIDNGIGSVAVPSGTHTVSPTATTTYTATATGAGGSVTASVTITVAPPPPTKPTIQLTADHTSITAGQPVTLSWSSTNATSISIDNGIGNVTAPSGTYTVSPTTTTTYTATATGAGGTATASVTINVAPAPAPTITSFTATPSTIDKGAVTTLAWQTTNATSVTLSPAIPAEDGQQLPVSGNAVDTPSATTTYTLTATGPGGTATATVTVTVNTPPPTITLTASPTSLISGQTSTLSWTSTNADTITIDNGIGSVTAPAGTHSVSPTTTTTYTATATGAGGTVTSTATVTVTPALAVTLTADKTQIGLGDTATLSWTSQGASSVDVEPGFGQVALSGQQAVQPGQTTTYTATAKDANGNTKTAQVTITVMGAGSFDTSIQHIIFFAQENRSFDNYFGMLGQYRTNEGLPNDIDGLDVNAVQYDENGVAVHPYHQATVCAENTSPSWDPSWHAFDQGAMDGFVSAHDEPTTIDPEYHRVMAYYTDQELPYYYELATQFATSDSWFSPVLAATIPNRMYLFSATSAGHIYPDKPPSGGWPMKTIFEELQAKGISWAYYYMDNSIFLGQFAAWNEPGIQQHVQPIDNYYNILQSPDADKLLPQVVFIERASSTGLDEHPDNNTQKGAAVAAKIINALLNSAAWPHSVFIHTYDEFGGLYDHVAPIAVPPPDNIQPILEPGVFDQNPYPNGDFAHSGFRLPVIVISPWVKPHFVSHVPRDTTSILKFIETRFGLAPLTKRDAWADNMIEFFDFSKPALLTPPSLPPQPTNGTCDVSKELDALP